MQPSSISAAFSGALASGGLLVFRLLHANQGDASLATQVLFWASAALLLGLGPGYYLVIGTGQRRFDKLWFRDPDELARFTGIINRMLVWFIAAVVTVVALSYVRL
jgi:hypothetical protein